MDTFGTVIAGTVDRLVRWLVLPVANVIPLLAASGALLAGFAALWLAFLVALIGNPALLDAAWTALTGLPLPVQAIAWLLLLPLTAGLWVWSTDWSDLAKLAVIGAIAAWNLLVLLPPRPSPAAVSAH